MKPGTVRLAAVAVVLVLLSQLAVAAAPAQQSYRIVIGYDGDPAAAKAAVKAAGFKIVRELDVFHAIVVEVKGLGPADAVDKARKGFMRHAKSLGVALRYAELDRLLYALELGTSPDIQWNVEMISAPAVWDYYYPLVGDAALGNGVQVRVLGTGIDYTHPGLSGKVVWCVDTADYPWTIAGNQLRYCIDRNGHGTHVAGIIAAALDGVGVAGVAPSVTLYAIKVLRNSGSGYVSDIAGGIYYAVAGPDGIVGTWDDAEVLSMSLGGPVNDPLLRDAAYWAYQNGAIVVAATSNEGDGDPTTDEVSYPARYPWVIAVAAVDINGDSPWWSSEGPEVDVAAPSVDVLSTYLRGGYEALSGTSMATTHPM